LNPVWEHSQNNRIRLPLRLQASQLKKEKARKLLVRADIDPFCFRRLSANLSVAFVSLLNVFIAPFRRCDQLIYQPAKLNKNGE